MSETASHPESARAEPGEEMVSAEALVFAYRPGQDVLRGASLRARVGELTCILGPNGCGKTTLLKCLMNRLQPGSGAVEINGAAAHRVDRGDEVIIMGFELSSVPLEPKSILVDAQNRFVRDLVEEPSTVLPA